MMDRLPQFPVEARSAAKEKRLVIFLGAGVSCEAGLPSWDQLKENLIDDCKLPAGIDSTIKDQLKVMNFYECFALIERYDKTTYEEYLSRAVAITKDVNMSVFKECIEIICSWNPVAIVTTNVDSLLIDNGKFSSIDFRFKEQCCPQEIRNGKVFFLHGKGEESIFSLFDLNKLYDNSGFKNFLYNLFGSYVVLFIGSSFRDDEMLKYALLNEQMQNNDEVKKLSHVALLPKDENQTERLKLYGIKPYYFPLISNPNKKYENFIRTLRKWKIKKPSIIEPDIQKMGCR